MKTERRQRRVSARLAKIADQIETLRLTQRKCLNRKMDDKSYFPVTELGVRMNKVIQSCSVQIHELTQRAEQLRKSLEPVDESAEIRQPVTRSGIKYCPGRIV